MAQLPGGQFDPSQYSDMQDFTPVPPGKYVVKIASSELKETSTHGQMLVLNFDIVAGPYTSKNFTSRLNLVNSNPKAVKIANEELATITRACNLGPVKDSASLHNIALVATLKLIPGDGKYGPKNEATFYASAQGLTAAPVNPEPDEATLAIINGTSVSGTANPLPTATAAAAPPPPESLAAAPPPPPESNAVPEVPAAPVPEVPSAPVEQTVAAPVTETAVGEAPPW